MSEQIGARRCGHRPEWFVDGTCRHSAHESVESILRSYGVAERDIGACCDDLSPHLRPPGSPRGLRYTDPRP